MTTPDKYAHNKAVHLIAVMPHMLWRTHIPGRLPTQGYSFGAVLAPQDFLDMASALAWLETTPSSVHRTAILQLPRKERPMIDFMPEELSNLDSDPTRIEIGVVNGPGEIPERIVLSAATEMVDSSGNGGMAMCSLEFSRAAIMAHTMLAGAGNPSGCTAEALSEVQEADRQARHRTFVGVCDAEGRLGSCDETIAWGISEAGHGDLREEVGEIVGYYFGTRDEAWAVTEYLAACVTEQICEPDELSDDAVRWMQRARNNATSFLLPNAVAAIDLPDTASASAGSDPASTEDACPGLGI